MLPKTTSPPTASKTPLPPSPPSTAKPFISGASSSATTSPPSASKTPLPPSPPSVAKPFLSSANSSTTISPPTASKPPSPPSVAKPFISRASSSTTTSPPTAASKKLAQPSPPSVTKPFISASASSKSQYPPAPPAETPKPAAPAPAPVAPPKKIQVRTQVTEMQTPGASSSRTTLEQIHRPFIHRSLGSEVWTPPQIAAARPPPAPPVRPADHEFGTPSAAEVKKADPLAKAPPSSTTTKSRSGQIEKSSSLTPPSLPLVVDTTRPRRMSDPVSPSPRSFAFADNVQTELKKAPDALPSILKKSRAPKTAKSKRVTIEEVSDEEDAEMSTFERLPVDSRFIFEPKPSVPPAMFSQIIDFSAEAAMPPTPAPRVPLPPTTTTATHLSENPPAISRGGFAGNDEKAAKDKHVRWTPSALGGADPSPRSSLVESDELRAALEALETNILAPQSVTSRKGPRSRTGSLVQPVTVGRKGKGKEKAVEQEMSEDELARFMMGAVADLKRGNTS
ncbi:hypothetical protein B0H10DRAFT_2068341 [Mycena sp. CBHHK59/15]|nr:hypothetical protein B0H10DRAFT_2068341 [Mycena sp. CBHHK59/15]